MVIQPSAKQAKFLASTADIAVYGGAAGGGKTYALGLEPLYHKDVLGFNAVFFRRTMPQIKNAGGLWDESYNLYKPLGAKPNKNDFTWTFGPQGSAYIKFDSLLYDNTVYDFQGAQIPLIAFDELTHFSASQFWYMQSRNRSTCGVKPYIRASTNPDASSWVKPLLAPWVDSKWAGKPAVSGELRYFVRPNDNLVWVGPDYVGPDGETPVSITFISASVYDNSVLMQRDPGYIQKLLSLNYVEKRRLLYGDWDILPEAGKVFNRAKFRRNYPNGSGTIVRFWDFAATEKQMKKPIPDYTVGVKMMRVGNYFFILDVIAVQAAPAEVDALVKATAQIDGRDVIIRWELEGGSGGKMVSHYLTGQLQGFNAMGVRPRGDKIQRARAFSAQVEAGHVSIIPHLPGEEEYLTELHHFPAWRFDDRVDATSGAYNFLVTESEAWSEADLAALRAN